jgi:hypothetical protein
MAGIALLYATGALAQGIQGIHPDTSPLQIGAGFTFLSYHEVPSTTWNNAGFDASAVYYRDWLGVEGDFSDAFGSQNSQSTSVLFAGGGVRLRMPNTYSFEPWVHAVVGYTQLSPQPTFGNNIGAGYKLGGGVDFNLHHSRIGYRVSADVLGSNFFHTYQFSPEVSVGIYLTMGKE